MGQHEMSFEATDVSIHDDEFCIVAGFADDATSPSRWLVLSRALEFDEQDRVLGHDTYHLEYCDQGRSTYGGIRQLRLRPGQITLILEPGAAADLDCQNPLCIRFASEQTLHARLEAQLGRIVPTCSDP